jgi:3-deoxy-D-manno-octulosonic-acid transferase
VLKRKHGFAWIESWVGKMAWFDWVYSALLMAVLVVGSPYWLVRMATSGRYRAGLWGRLGRVPKELMAWREPTSQRRDVGHPNSPEPMSSISQRSPRSQRRDLGHPDFGGAVVWVHAVSVGEVLVAARLIEEFRRVRPELRFAVSTTTKTGQELARKRLADSSSNACGVFYLPLDFAWAVRRYLKVLQPKMLVLVESELWPNLLAECGRAGVPVAVANARISDRSFPRYMRLRGLWRPLLAQVRVFLAQSAETGERLEAIGGEALRGRVVVTGNVKYDARVGGESRVAELIREAAGERPVVVAGSTVEGKPVQEEELVMRAMGRVWETMPEVLLVLAPRHPDRFGYAYSLAAEHGVTSATEMLAGKQVPAGARQTVVLDTIGDLAAVYGVADAAFVGGSLVQSGGHNPLEPARFGVPVVMGGSYENFREIVERMRAADGIRLVGDASGLGEVLVELLRHRDGARALGERGQRVFEAQQGATARTVAALLEVLKGPEGNRRSFDCGARGEAASASAQDDNSLSRKDSSRSQQDSSRSQQGSSAQRDSSAQQDSSGSQQEKSLSQKDRSLSRDDGSLAQGDDSL